MVVKRFGSCVAKMSSISRWIYSILTTATHFIRPPTPSMLVAIAATALANFRNSGHKSVREVAVVGPIAECVAASERVLASLASDYVIGQVTAP